jgi:hypothetical protein
LGVGTNVPAYRGDFQGDSVADVRIKTNNASAGGVALLVDTGNTANPHFKTIYGQTAGVTKWAIGSVGGYATDGYIGFWANGAPAAPQAILFPSGGFSIGNTTDPGAGALRISDNLVIATSGKGIDFSATPGTGTSELLADYEEGTWTPTLPNGGTLGLQSALYTKVGRQVTVTFYVNAIAPTNNGSNFLIGGLPFTIESTGYYGGSFAYVGDGNLNGWLVIGLTGTTTLGFRVDTGNAAARTNAQYITAASGSDDSLIITITYFV